MLKLPCPGGRPVLGITIGDPSGIGPEITLKALDHRDIYEISVPVVYAGRIVLEDAVKLTGKKLNLRQINEPQHAAGSYGTVDYIETGVIAKDGEYAYGVKSAKSGEAAFQYVLKAIEDALAGKIAAVVTCPVSKEAVNMAGHHFAGHTEIFAHYTETKDYRMLLSSGNGKDSLNVIHVTTHVSLRQACDLINKERVLKTIRLADLALRLMGKKERRIAVAALNPHCSENGLFGDEEKKEIIPAIEEARAAGLDVTGPLPADTVFVKARGGLFDIVVAMYHDQGHIPLKLAGFSIDKTTALFSKMRGTNATIGLPIIRTSVDHGTAFDMAGKNLSNEDSLLDAIEMAAVFAGNWQSSLF
jgi:4-hydroxythreonine-4-phosphate dehydrogenase